MPFVKIDKSRRASTGETVVSMGTYLADGKKHMTKSVAFRISAALLKQLGWVISEGKIALGVHEGTGVDKGFLQLVLDPQGYRGSQGKETEEGAGIGISITSDRFKHYVLNECPVSAVIVAHTIDGDALVVECPDWLRYNPLSEPQPEPEKVTHINERATRRGRHAR